MFASTSLLESELADEFDWIVIDSTADSNTIAPIWVRLKKAVVRLITFFYFMVFSRIDFVFIFTGDGFSFLEKGFMAILGKFFRKKVILAPRSGFVVNDIEKKGYLSKFIPYVLTKVDRVICQGESWKVFYCNLVPHKPQKDFIVIPNWIDTKSITPMPIEDGVVDILFLAWVDKQKGIFDLLEVVSQLKDETIKLHICGNGSAMKEVTNYIESNNLNSIVYLHGWVRNEDKVQVLNQADIFVLPSYAEGFPNALLEAMAYGKACISTDVGSVKDFVSHDVNGLLYQAGDKDALKKNLKSLINNQSKRETLGYNAKETALKNHSIDAAVSSFKNIFETI